MNQPSEEALRAADAFMKWNGETSVPKYMLEARDRLACMIDQETNLPALKARIAELEAVICDAITRLEGHPDSKLDGENGLAAATMRLLKHYGAQCEKE